ncbi:EAL domain-containing protein [Paenalkalicoccus suaedae]|uniref:EAL domain-containing protein n=1 Tax=Paenalkalicoccus suaedae TaxID=2592382 RepID=A0A859FFZ8_9BACI|nr:EAL domain-containing protein [Paenalkalicoccus suaedae]QKS71602.1 EAL domain-containing protein [Paenalkalicoccus suaedae]
MRQEKVKSDLINLSILHALEEEAAIIDRFGKVIMVNTTNEEERSSEKNAPVKARLGSDYVKNLELANECYLQERVQLLLKGKLTDIKQINPYQQKEDIVWYEIRITAFIHEGERCGLIRYKDVTALVSYESQVIDVLESMNDGFFAVDKMWRMTYVNAHAASMLRKSVEELRGNDMWLMYPNLHGTPFELTYRRAMETRERQEIEAYYPAHHTWYSVRVYPHDEGGLAFYFQDIHERKEVEDRLYHAAYYDEMTKLPNRKKFYQVAEEKFEVAKPTQEFSLLFIDIDQFKTLNNLYGYAKGDELVKEIAKRIRYTCQGGGYVARFGGDEFVILYEGSPKDDGCRSFTSHLLYEVQKPIRLDNDKSYTPSVHVGISHYPFHATKVEALLSMADTALNEAKRKKVLICMYNEEIKKNLAYKNQLLHAFFDAVKTSDIFFVYQPQVNLHTGEIVTLEALTRWSDERLGAISPAEFIPLLEESGHIDLLTKKLVHDTFRELHILREKHDYKGSLSINMPTQLLHDHAFITFFEKTVKAAQFPSQTVEIELTESAELVTSDDILYQLDRLRQAGVKIAIDDFGKGYSNFIYLTEINAEKIKLDASFIRQIGIDKKSEDVLEGLIILSDKIGSTVVAEGVETESQLQFLQRTTCDVIQGFYYYKPMPIEDIHALFSAKQ